MNTKKSVKKLPLKLKWTLFGTLLTVGSLCIIIPLTCNTNSVSIENGDNNEINQNSGNRSHTIVNEGTMDGPVVNGDEITNNYVNDSVSKDTSSMQK